jgi:hypothetical protein
MEIIIFLIIPAIFAYITANMAEKRGRNKWTGAFCGFFFGIFAVTTYAIIGDTEERKTGRMTEALRRANLRACLKPCSGREHAL